MRKVLLRTASLILMVTSMALATVLVISSVGDIRIMSVESGSMEPELSTRDMIVVTPCVPERLEVGDIISYTHGGTVVTHRVTANRTSLGELETKGDANEYVDLEPVPYENVIGSMRMCLPNAREPFEILSAPVGKVYLAMAMLVAILLWVRSNQVGGRTNRPDLHPEDGRQGNDGRRPRRRLATVIKVLLLVTFVASTGMLVRYRLVQKSSMDIVEDARRTYRKDAPKGETPHAGAPIDIDFDALRAANPDVVGWIYCEGTQIDFPVLKGNDNDFYLRRNWKREDDFCGSIFVDADASDGFADARTVVYGHHMNDNLMFASLEEWGNQGFYEEHPVMWLLTPDGDYKMELVAGEHIPAESDAYVPAKEHDEAFSSWLTSYVASSDFKASAEANPKANYVMLSTCAYVYENARFTLLGKLVAI